MYIDRYAAPVPSAAPSRQAAPAPDLLGGLDDEPQRYMER